MKKVIVAISGGVDSSTACLLLKEQGFEVVGVYFKLWSPEDKDLFEQTAEFVKDVADKLEIEFIAFDLKERFKKEVVERFVKDYLEGKTPNPCAVCNQKIKFWALFELADKIKADYIATGHYVRTRFNACSGEWEILKAKDRLKDQSYFLFLLNKNHLPRIIFPLGELTKSEVKELAKKYNLPTAERRESADLCFVRSGRYAKVIELVGGKKPQSGQIIDTSGKYLGKHKGFYNFTIGQRRGLRLSIPDLYVIKLVPEKNQVVVGEERLLYHKKMLVRDVNWLAKVNFPLRCEAKIRYQGNSAECIINPSDEGKILVEFFEPQRAITPGQAGVFYRGDRLLGGGWIESAFD